MALATEAEWESDPELKAMRRDFVASFAARRAAVEAELPKLGRGGENDAAALQAIRHVAHKLAGAAETYGFPTLTRACAAFEDWFDGRESGHDAQVARAGAELVVLLLERSEASGKDVPELASDPRFALLEKA
jgi:chemotaxis protein histidine kinase CheA